MIFACRPKNALYGQNCSVRHPLTTFRAHVYRFPIVGGYDYNMSDITVVLTSCRRHDLLVKTLESFFGTNDYPIAEFIVIEDSDLASVESIRERFPDQPLRFIMNGTNIGQLRSIDRAYAEVKTPYILHLEDDWEFPVGGILARAVEILKRERDVYLVQLRTDADMPDNVRRIPEMRDLGYRKIAPTAHHVWHSFTFNPSLKRLADYQMLPSGYAGFANEAEISLHYKKQGAIMAWLSGTGVGHIGWGRSNFGFRPQKGLKGVWQRVCRFLSLATIRKWRRSLGRRAAHLRRLLWNRPIERRPSEDMS